jgi:thioredoxin-dependent peroxiredoxin
MYVRRILVFSFTAALVLAVALVTVNAANKPMPKVGQPAPTFTLPAQDGSNVSLASFHGKWVVLFFYPKDLAAGSTTEAKAFQQDLPKYEEMNSVVLGVSEDSVASHKKFAKQAGITIKLLSDSKGTVAGNYGVLGTVNGAPAANRITFLINPEGKISKVYSGVAPANHTRIVSNDLGAKPPIVH